MSLVLKEITSWRIFMGVRIDDWAFVSEAAHELLGPDASKLEVERLAEQIGLAAERGTIQRRWIKQDGQKVRIVFMEECFRLATTLSFSISPDYTSRFNRAKAAERELTNSLGNWPWGTHETPLLRKLAEAASKFWSLYDPNDPSSAPTNSQVENWLTSKGVSQKIAEVMATILRAEGLRRGPRK